MIAASAALVRSPALVRSDRAPADAAARRKWPLHLTVLVTAGASTGLWSLIIAGVGRVIS